jgi:opacity protein-like surface antigen
MHSKRLTFFSVAALALTSSVVHAADYSQPIYQPEPQPQPIIIQQPAPAAFDCCDGWYLRGQVGVGMNNAEYELSTSPLPPGARYVSQSISDSYFVGLGVGYNWNSWLRFEGTVDYRARTQLSALGRFPGGPAVFLDQLDGYMKSWVFLANAFVDLGTWNCFTPFVGAGIGMAWHQMVDFKDVTPLTPGLGSSAFGVGRDESKWSFAWALYAGVAYNVTKSFKIDFTYRYMDLGSAREIINCAGPCGQTFTHDFKNLSSHDFMVGFRWECCDLPAPPPPMVYTPPPPPLRSKG